MKRVLAFAFCFISFCSSGQYSDDAASNRNIVLLLEKFTAGTMDSSERKQIAQLTYAIQNKGFFHAEPYKAKYDSSLREIDRALIVWSTLRDTANMANLRKFRGFVLGKLKRFEAGKKDAREAIRLFTLIKRSAGVAVSQYDLSLVCIMASQPDSAIYFGRMAYEYFRQQNVLLRMLIFGNQLLQTYGGMKRYQEALIIQKQLQAAISAYKEEFTRFEVKHVADFHSLSRDLYKKLGQNREFEYYQKRYENYLAWFQTEGVMYANDHPGF